MQYFKDWLYLITKQPIVLSSIQVLILHHFVLSEQNGQGYLGISMFPLIVNSGIVHEYSKGLVHNTFLDCTVP